MTFDKTKKVLIAGGGLAGLSLANVLKHQGVPYQVYERDAADLDRSQGYSLTLHFCLWDLKSAMDPVKYATLSSVCAVDPENPRNASFGLIDGNTGECKAIMGAPPQVDVFRVNRRRLRDWLLDGIDVQHDKQVESYKVTEDGVEVTFTDGTTDHGSVLIGADGVNSRVCEQLLGPEEFARATVHNPLNVMAGSYWIDEEYRNEIISRFSYAHFIGTAEDSEDANFTTCLFGSLMDVDHSRDKPYQMMWSVSCNHNEAPLDTDAKRVQQAKKWVRKAQFHKSFSRLIEDSPDDTKVFTIRIRERSPSTFLDTYRGPIILIGDAAHSMTQYRGEGGCHGIQDAAILGALLKGVYSGEKSLKDALDEYYADMLPRTRKAVTESHEAAELFHGPFANVVDFINSSAARVRKQVKALEEAGVL